MPKMACNGFSMFANHCRSKLEAQRGRKFQRGMKELIEACTPLWRELSDEERARWKLKSREYKRTDEYSERKRANRHSKRSNLPAPGGDHTFKPGKHDQDSSLDDDCDSEEDPGVPMVRSAGIQGRSSTIRLEPDNQYLYWEGHTGLNDGDKETIVHFMDRKKREDKRRITEFFQKECGGRLVDVKRCRFLLITMQTYGELAKGVFIPTELSMVEWSLALGIMDELSAIIGPWKIENETLRERASFNASQTHLIPLEGVDTPEFTVQRRRVLRELLGRAEPGIAANQDVRVGLYKDGLVELPDVPTSEKNEAGFKLDEDGNKQRKQSGGSEKVWPLLPGDTLGRRWLVCLESEFEGIMQGIKYLKDTEKIEYDGFPVTPDRFVFLETVVETLAEFVGTAVPEKFWGQLAALMEPKNRAYSTPWDQTEQVYCDFHRKANFRTNFCAVGIGRKACLATFIALKDGFDLPV